MRNCWIVLSLIVQLVAASTALAQLGPSPLIVINEQGEVAPVRGPFVFGPADEQNKHSMQTCEQAIGKRVRVEGIGWHPEESEKMLNPESLPRVILEGGTVYIRGDGFNREKAHGKLVRAVGTLKPYAELNERMRQIYGQPIAGCALEFLHQRVPPRYYLIETTSLKVVSSIEQPRLELQPDQ